MSIRPLLPLMLLLPTAAWAQQAPSTAASAADKFSLDIPADDAVTAPAAAAPVTTPTAAPAAFSLDTPIAALIADPAAKAVLDRNLPDLSTDPNIDKFKALSLRKLAPLSGGQLTAALLASTERDLAAVTPSRPAKAPPRSLPIGR